MIFSLLVIVSLNFQHQLTIVFKILEDKMAQKQESWSIKKLGSVSSYSRVLPNNAATTSNLPPSLQ